MQLGHLDLLSLINSYSLQNAVTLLGLSTKVENQKKSQYCDMENQTVLQN